MCIFNRQDVNGPIIAYKICSKSMGNVYNPQYKFTYNPKSDIIETDSYKYDSRKYEGKLRIRIPLQNWRMGVKYKATPLSEGEWLSSYFGFHAFENLSDARSGFRYNYTDIRQFVIVKVKLLGNIVKGIFPMSVPRMYEYQKMKVRFASSFAGEKMILLKEVT